MKKTMRLFVIGAMGYTLIEMLWRGHSHWSMAIAGGISLAVLFNVFEKLKDAPVYFKSIVGGEIITAIEFIFGVVFNLYLGMSVWDYSEVKGNILGQICPLYSMLWCFICIPIAAAESFFDGEKFAMKREVIP